ncbi:HTH-type transcriptional regulator immR, partial [Dysosmobacter welbionis]
MERSIDAQREVCQVSNHLVALHVAHIGLALFGGHQPNDPHRHSESTAAGLLGLHAQAHDREHLPGLLGQIQ